MSFSISAGITTKEFSNLVNTVPAVATTIGALAGVFTWGPVNKAILVDSENNLVKLYGKPKDFNAETWFSAGNFLAYSNQLYVNRVAEAAFNAIAKVGTANADLHIVNNEDDYETKKASFQSNVHFIAKYPGDLGNSLRVSVCDNAAKYSSTVELNDYGANTKFDTANTKFSIDVGSRTGLFSFSNTSAITGNTPEAYVSNVAGLFSKGDIVEVGNTSIGKQEMKIKSVSSILIANTAGANTGAASFSVEFEDFYKLHTAFSTQDVKRKWEHYGLFSRAPGTSAFVTAQGNTAAVDQVHVVVSDIQGKIQPAGSVLEVFEGLSRATDAKGSDGTSIYYKTAINQRSSYIWAASDMPSATTANAALIASASGTVPYAANFTGGADGNSESAISIGSIAQGYDVFKDAETYDISLLITGKSRGGTHGELLGNYLIDNVAEARKDCVVFISPDRDDVVNNNIDPDADVVQFADAIRSTSYAVLDSGYKYQYDKYNDVMRWIPLNADVAGLCVNTDLVRDPWFSPAGFNRGNVLNVAKLAFSPNQAQRDLLYRNRVNPVVTFAGKGTVLYGDKTALATSNAFDRINVRRLFIVLEKAIATAAQATLFEFNDEFTRAQFRNMVEPYLRDIKGRRGITDFKVICDSTNNTGEVIDTNRFVGDIYIKPARSINFINLNFIAVGTDVAFNEVVGEF
jgi:hypothetical protein